MQWRVGGPPLTNIDSPQFEDTRIKIVDWILSYTGESLLRFELNEFDVDGTDEVQGSPAKDALLVTRALDCNMILHFVNAMRIDIAKVC